MGNSGDEIAIEIGGEGERQEKGKHLEHIESKNRDQ